MPQPKEGDSVKIVTDEEELEGILMPRPGILEQGFTVLKLKNGYNIGIDEKKIKKIELSQPYKPKKQEKRKLTAKKGLPTVAIISTGGTISSRIDYRTGGVYADYTAEDFVAMCPELADVANLKAKKLMNVMSEDLMPEDWQKMAREISAELKDVDGIVITQGTDTLHFTAAALSFFLRLDKPVVITAAQRSIDRGSSDAFMNLICSVTAAARFDGAGVYSCMHGTSSDDYCLLIRGTKVRKMHTSRRDAFRPINELPIAKVFPDGRIDVLNKRYDKRGQVEPKSDESFEEKTALIQTYPGMDPKVVDFYLKEGYKGLVIAATALGHVPTNCNKEIVTNLKKAIDKGVAVVIATQTLYGRVHPLVYTNLRKLSVELGCIFAEDMTPETAYAKLGWVLGHTTKHDEVKKMMLQNISGEINPRINADSFLY
ncbi:Glu-tRNA(Gln) amidotransferase subunit GatD [Candidatus Woesearchaeota archaeon]|nr:Glu-tRNA(Gln) amidotransferase subunit GatD [Candidatus Woesearchaeota archaeon]